MKLKRLKGCGVAWAVPQGVWDRIILARRKNWHKSRGDYWEHRTPAGWAGRRRLEARLGLAPVIKEPPRGRLADMKEETTCQY